MGTVEAGTVVGGKYRLDEPIGEGGMASVWRATHTTLESTVAVKFLDLMGVAGRDTMKQRFLREAKLAANLKHRNVVHILDFGVLDVGDQPFMVMELLEGQSLGDRFEVEDDLDEVAMMDVFADLLGGLAAVHDAGIVHRDVKPDNVFLVVDSDGEYPKLLDFGVSRSRGSARVTAANTVVGTPAYMSPEQALGEDDLDQRSDLFGVGVMLYEFFAGLIPFETGSPAEVMIRVATEDMPPLSQYRPDLPESVHRLVDRAVRRERADRFEDARVMRAALLDATEALSDAPRRGTKPSRRRAVAEASTVVTAQVAVPAAEPPLSSRRLGILGAVMACALMLGVGLAWRLGSQPETDPPAPTASPEPASNTGAAPAEPATPAVAEPEIAVAEPPEADGPARPDVGAVHVARTAPDAPEPSTEVASPDPPAPAVDEPPPVVDEPPPVVEPPTAAPDPEPPRPRPQHARPPRRPRESEPAEQPGGFLRNLDY